MPSRFVLLCTLLVACPSPSDTPAPPPVAVPVPPPAAPPPVPVVDAALPESAPTEGSFAARHVLIAWQGAVRAPAEVTRTEAEARAEAEAIWRQVKGGANLAAIARARSDDASAPRGGALGVFLAGTMVPAFEAAVAGAEVGELAPLARTPFGWHVIVREPVREVHVAHLVIGWAGAERGASSRSKEEARALAEAARARVAGGEPFAAVAAELSEDPSAAVGGDLGRIAPGQLVPAFEDAAFALGVGQISAVVETPYGYHVIQRRQ